jgi:hypothetical protein
MELCLSRWRSLCFFRAYFFSNFLTTIPAALSLFRLSQSASWCDRTSDIAFQAAIRNIDPQLRSSTGGCPSTLAAAGMALAMLASF